MDVPSSDTSWEVGQHPWSGAPRKRELRMPRFRVWPVFLPALLCTHPMCFNLRPRGLEGPWLFPPPASLSPSPSSLPAALKEPPGPRREPSSLERPPGPLKDEGRETQPSTHSDRCPRSVPPPSTSGLGDGAPDTRLVPPAAAGRTGKRVQAAQQTDHVHPRGLPHTRGRLLVHVTRRGRVGLSAQASHPWGPAPPAGGPENPLC